MRKTLFLIVFIVIGVCCLSAASADGITFSQNGSSSNFVHGIPITVNYDIRQQAGKNNTYDHAEIRATAWYGDNFYEYAPVRISGTRGTCSFPNTDRGDRLWFVVMLKDKDDMYLGEQPSEIIHFTDGWSNKPVVPTLSVTRNQTSVTAGTPISASYQITGGNGDYTECRVGWAVRDEQGGWIASSMQQEMPASGILTMDSPTAKGTHYVQMTVKDTSGWTFQAEAHSQGIEVTTDGTGEPLSIALTWKDENGKVLDWSKDCAVPNQQIYMSWQMRGGYTPYEGYLNLDPVSGQTSFGHMGRNGASGTLEFNIESRQDVVIEIEYHDNHENKKIQQVTIPVGKMKPILHGDYIWLDGTAEEIDFTLYTGIPVHYDNTVWQRTDFIKYDISNWDEMRREYGGYPEWTVQLSRDIPGYLVKEQGERFVGCIDIIPTQVMDAEAVLTCTWGGQSTSRIIRLQIVNPDFTLPTGVDNLPDMIETEEGATLTLAPTILPSTWSLSGYSPKYFAANGLRDFVDPHGTSLINNAIAGEYEIANAGRFEDVVGLSYGALMVTKHVRFEVKDETGNIPSRILKLSQRNYYPHINRYLGMTNAIEAETGVFSWNLLAGADIEDYDQLKMQLGGKPKWMVTQTGGEPLPYTWAVEMDGQRADVRLDAQDLTDANYQPGTAQITIRCDWGEETAYAVTNIDLLYPPNGLPDGIAYNNGEDIVECQVGDTLMITPTIVPSTWPGIPGFDSEYVGNSDEFERFCQVIDEGTWGRELLVNRAGIFQCFIGVGTDTITAGRWITYRVKNAQGIIPIPEAEFEGWFGLKDMTDLDQTAVYYVNPQIGIESVNERLYSTDHLFSWGIANMEEIFDYLEEDPQYSVELTEGNVKYKTETEEDRSYLYVSMTEMPKAGSATFKVTCTVLGKTYERTVKFRFTEIQSLPTGLTGDFGSPKIMKVGDAFPFYPEIGFANGWHAGDGNGTGGLYGGDDEFFDMIDWEGTPTVGQAGVIDVPLVAYSENLYMEKTVRYVFTEADGTINAVDYKPFGTAAKVPAWIQRIESEAFAGTKITEIDIPTGVEIAEDAFKDSGLIAVYTHNDDETIAWAVSHGVVAVTE